MDATKNNFLELAGLQTASNTDVGIYEKRPVKKPTAVLMSRHKKNVQPKVALSDRF